jgi:hypothetical protein
MTNNEEYLSELFNREITDDSILATLNVSNKAMAKMLPGLVSRTEKIMSMTDEECHEELKKRGIVL